MVLIGRFHLFFEKRSFNISIGPGGKEIGAEAGSDEEGYGVWLEVAVIPCQLLNESQHHRVEKVKAEPDQTDRPKRGEDHDSGQQ